VPSDIGPHTFAQAASPARNTTTGSIVPGSDGTTVGNITCFSCNANGHYATNCPSAISLVQYAYVLTQSADGPEYACKSISKDWILLDSQSSISVFNNALMLTNIRESPQPVIVKTNGGCQTSSQIGDFRNLGWVWYNPGSIANILSLSHVSRVCRVTFDSAIEPTMVIHKMDGTYMRFKQHTGGLYYYDTKEQQNVLPLEDPYMLLQTVTNNKAKFVTREVEAADAARELYRKVGRPSLLPVVSQRKPIVTTPMDQSPNDRLSHR
jgi:Zinc knuckle